MSAKQKSKAQYLLAERIARGGMAEIYLGTAAGKDAFQRIVAIKRILPHYAQDKEFVTMFRDEANICKRLQHVNIVQVYDFTEVKGSYALIMEHVDGADFKTVLVECDKKHRMLKVPMTLYIIANVAKGLHYAHTKVDDISGKNLGIVHRDISPQNILLSYEGEVKITDFGIAAAADKNQETRPGVVKGKYSYMSPEQVQAKPLDGRSDLFSLAIVFWEALAMKRLFAGKTEVQTIRKVQNCEIPLKLTDLNKEVGEELMEIVHKGLSKDAKKRYQTGAEFEKSILKYLNSKYPDFLSSQLGDFLKQILKDKRDKSQEVIKKALTNVDSNDMIESPVSQGPIGLLEQSQPSKMQVKKSIQKFDMHLNGRSAINPTISRSNPKSKLQQLNPLHYRTQRKKSSSQKILISIIALISLLGILIFTQNKNMTLSKKILVYLETEPNKVHITVDGNPISPPIKIGKVTLQSYSKTPIEIRIKPNRKRHKIKIKRPGYKSETIIINDSKKVWKPGKVILTPKKGAGFINLTLKSRTTLKVDVDSGLATGITPFKVNFLSSEIAHVISYRSPKKKFWETCEYKARSFRPGNYLLEINLKAPRKNRCTMRKR